MLAAWAGVWLLARHRTQGDWHFLVTGAHLLFSSHGLHLYALRPDLQIGPLALVVAAPLTLLPPWTVHVVVLGLGLVTVRCAELTARRLIGPTSDARVLCGGLMLLSLWSFVATSGHLDDALAITAVLLAAVAVVHENPWATGALLGCAVSCKPWALVSAPLLLGLVRGTNRVKAGAALAAVVTLCWAPFVIGELGTLRALSAFHIGVSEGSGLHVLLGLSPGGRYPEWVRPAQLGVGLALACALALRGRWWAVPLVGFGVRLLLDPGSWTYYGAGVAAGALLADLVSRRRLPVASLLCFAALFYPGYLRITTLAKGYDLLADPGVRHLLDDARLAGCAVAMLSVVSVRRRPPSASTTKQPLAVLDRVRSAPVSSLLVIERRGFDAGG